MKQVSKRHIRNAQKGGDALRTLRSVAGFTLTEALATVIIVGLVTSMLAGGIALATRQYVQSMAASESQMLYSSLQQILDTELRYTSTIYTSGTNGDGSKVVIGYSSKHFRVQGDTPTPYLRSLNDEGKPQNMGEYGQLALCASTSPTETVVSRILGTGSYNYGLGAKVTYFSYDAAKKRFKITLSVGRADNAEPLVSQTFTVKALNIQEVK